MGQVASDKSMNRREFIGAAAAFAAAPLAVGAMPKAVGSTATAKTTLTVAELTKPVVYEIRIAKSAMSLVGFDGSFRLDGDEYEQFAFDELTQVARFRRAASCVLLHRERVS